MSPKLPQHFTFPGSNSKEKESHQQISFEMSTSLGSKCEQQETSFSHQFSGTRAKSLSKGIRNPADFSSSQSLVLCRRRFAKNKKVINMYQSIHCAPKIFHRTFPVFLRTLNTHFISVILSKSNLSLILTSIITRRRRIPEFHIRISVFLTQEMKNTAWMALRKTASPPLVILQQSTFRQTLKSLLL
ncbi:hypothetical protein NPIL_494421 [Nephila pilipes]|uniref:Uncharacterized protein n=1 Tax=Nephila pilipes TaxID=299642 RepID=A0A8X6UF90_NEPPI|nr:hypothetical protein NPIL_494421 [Nephila pilipes]